MATDATKLVIVLEAQSKKLQNSLVQVNRNIDRFAAATERRFEQMNARNAASFEKLNASVRGSLGRLQGFIAPVVGTLGVREIVRFSDAWTEASNKVAAASQVAGIEGRSLDELKTSANGARVEFAEYVDLYSRLLRVSPGVAATELEVARAADIVSRSFKAGGASAQEQAAGLIQLGQAIGSGFLQGDELRSIRENAPLLAQAIADEFGVTIGELKKLGAEGEVTSARVFKAILAGGEGIDAAFARTQSTIQDAFTRIENEFIAYVGTAGQAEGATQGLIEALNYVADNFKDISNTVVQFSAILAGAFAGKAIVGGIGAATVALGAFLTALRAGTLTAVTFTAALGPIGLLAGAAAAAMVLLYNAQFDAQRAADAHSEALVENQSKLDLARESSDKYRKALQKQIALQLAAADAALAEASAQLEAAEARADLGAQNFESGAATMIGPGASGQAPAIATTSAIRDAATSEARARLEAAKQRVADFRRQLAEIDNIRLTPEGTGDSAGGGKLPGGGGGSGSKDKKNEYEKATESILKRTAALQAETAAQAGLNPLINDYGFAVERAKAETELLAAAHEAGLEITPQLRAAVAMLAESYAGAGVEAKKLAEAQGEIRDKAIDAFATMRDVTQGFISDLLQGKSAAEALGNALSNIGNKLIDMGLNAIFGTGSGSNPFGLLGNAFGFADGGVAAHGRPRKFASGGISKTAAIFGEAGPEAAVPLPDGRRIPVDLRMPHGGTGGGITVNVNQPVDATGADQAAIVRLETALAKSRAELPAQVVKAVREAKKTRNL